MKLSLDQVRILIADGDTVLSGKLASYLRDSGFQTKAVSNGYLLPKVILEWRPHFIIIDLMFPGFYAQQCLNFLRERNLLGDDGIRVIVTSNHNAEVNVMSCLQAGADDFLVKPLQFIELLHRLALLSQTKKFNFEPIVRSDNSKIQYYFQMIDLLVKCAAQKKPKQMLRFELIRMLSLALKAVRTSVIENSELKDNAWVSCSSDDEKLTQLDLQLTKYPEIQYLLRTEKPLFIEAIDKDKTMNFIQNKVKTISFNSMIVLPLHYGSKMVGCMSIRMPKDRKQLSVWDIKVAQIAAQLVAMTWKFKTIKKVRNKKAS